MRLVTTFAFLLFGCSIFPKQEVLLAKHKRANGDEIGIYQVSMGATTNDAIQVRKKISIKFYGPVKITTV